MTENKPARKPPKVYSSGKPLLKRGQKPGATRTSAAKIKRKAEGLNPPKSKVRQAAGHASDISGKLKFPDPERVHAIAKVVVDNPELKPIMIKKLQSQEQRLMDELKQSLIRSAPRAAAYLSDLVDGVHESAPHAVRMGAASKIIDSAVAFHANSAGSKDLSEMTAAELEAELNALGNALASRTAEDAEVIEQKPEPARPGNRALE